MVKKLGIVFIVIVLVVAAIVAYNFLAKQNVKISPSINAVPPDAAVIIESQDFYAIINTLKTESNIWKELINIKSIGELNQQMLYLDSIFNSNKKAKELASNRSVIISAHMIGKENFDFLYLINQPASFSEESVHDFIAELVSKKGTISERVYSEHMIYDAKPNIKDRFHNFSFSSTNGIFIFSFSSLLVEKAIRQLDTDENSLIKDNGFNKVQKTAGKNVGANIYLNFKTLPKVLAVFFNDHYKQSLTNFTNCATWTELDANIKTDAVLLNGFTYSNDSANNYLNIFNGQSPQNFEFEEYLPDNTACFIGLGISDFQKFEKDYKQYLDGTGEKERELSLKKVDEDYNFDIREVFYSFLEKEVVLAYTDVNSKNIDESTFVILKTKSRSMAEDKLKEELKKIAVKENKQFDEYIDVHNIDEEISFPIYTMPVKYLAGKLFGNLFIMAETNYFTFFDNYLIFGDSKKALSKYIHSLVLQRTLKSDLNYSKFSENLSSRSNFYFYSNIAISSGLMKAYLSDDLRESVDDNVNTIQKFQAFAFQFSQEKGMFYNNIFLHYDPVFKIKPHTIWESRLDTICTMKPRLITNHNTQDNEIFVQDQANNIYMINSQGRILWKAPLDEPIISDVYQVDFYRNNKLQLLFSTKTKIHLLDRTGNYVERYPIKFRSNASNGIAVFDYDNNRDYRILVACNDRKIYAYSIEGNVLSGWEFDKTESMVHDKLQHMILGDKDYIVFADSLKIYVTDRRGNSRVKLESQFAKSKNNIFYLDEKKDHSKSKIITTDTSGVIRYIYFDGKVASLDAGGFSSNHYFDFKDMNNDGEGDFIMVDKSKLSIFRQNKKEIFSYEFDNNINNKPIYFLFPNDEGKIGIVNSNSDEIYLFNSDGGIYEGFPLEGNGLFSIGHLSQATAKFNLMVGSKDGFLYNYEVH